MAAVVHWEDLGQIRETDFDGTNLLQAVFFFR